MDKFYIGIDHELFEGTQNVMDLIDLSEYDVTTKDGKHMTILRDEIKVFWLYESENQTLLVWSPEKAPRGLTLKIDQYKKLYESLEKSVTGKIEQSSITIPGNTEDYDTAQEESNTDELYQADDERHQLGAYQHDYYVWFDEESFTYAITKKTPAPIAPDSSISIKLTDIDTSQAVLMDQDELNEALEGGRVFGYLQVNRLLFIPTEINQ